MFGLPTHLQHTDDAELKQILQQTIMLQNGMVASLMAKSGVRGLMNYGVSLPDLRRIAAETILMSIRCSPTFTRQQKTARISKQDYTGHVLDCSLFQEVTDNI